MNEAQRATLAYLCEEPGLPRWHYFGLKSLPREYYQIRHPRTAAMFSSTAHPTKAGQEALAAGAQSAETNEDLAQSEGRQSGAESATPSLGNPPSPSIGSIDMTLISGANPALIPSEPSQSSLSRPVGFDPGERKEAE